MPSPFPGMDPYLERASLWPNVHNSLIIALRDDLASRLRPRYYVAVEERTVRLTPDDLALHCVQTWLSQSPFRLNLRRRVAPPDPGPGRCCRGTPHAR